MLKFRQHKQASRDGNACKVYKKNVKRENVDELGHNGIEKLQWLCRSTIQDKCHQHNKHSLPLGCNTVKCKCEWFCKS